MAKKVKSLKRIKLALFTAVFVACGIPPSTLSEIKIAQADEVVEANNGSTLAGEGTVTSPYLIATKSGLEKFRDIVIGANGETRNSAAHARLVANIDLENSSWEPIGSYYYIYQGTFDGAGHTVSGLSVNKPSTSRVGFFGYIKNATIKNLTLQGSVVGSQMVGGVVGQMGDYSTGNSTIYNCINECSVHSTFVPSKSYDDGGKFGGIVGCVDGGNNVVSKCTNRGAITTNATGDTSSHAGGIVGYAGYKPVTIKNCVNTGNITATAYSAGIVSYVSGADVIITGCFNHGNINNVYEYTDSRGSSYTGGIVAHAYGKDDNHIIISHCGNTGTVYGRRACNAGVAAEAYRCDVSNCYNTGNVTGTTACGVICNGYYMNLTNAYNTGAIRSLSDRSDITSGVLGSTSNSHISYVYNYGSVANASGVAYPYTRRGSIAGDIGTNSTATSTYFLDGTYHTGIGTIGNNSTGSSTKLSAAQMRTQSSFSGWDFNNVWVMGDNYPLLRHSHDYVVNANQATHQLVAACDRPYCEESDVTYSLTLHAPTLERERSGGNANATLDAEELAAFNAGTGLNVSSENITYEKIENNQVTSLGTTAPTTFGEYRVELTVGREFVTINYSIAKLEVDFDENVTLDGEVSTSTVSNLNGETATSLLTDEEIEEYLNGKDVSISLKVTTEDGDLKIPALDKSVIKNTLTPESGVKEGAYLDLSLYKKIGSEAAKAIHESPTTFDITLDIPESILNAPFGATRTFSIVRVHNGVAETLSSTVSDGKISFSTDKFSTYLIAYNDTYEAEGEFIEFTPAIEGDSTVYINNESVGSLFTVNYKITHNDGFNSILLIPQYDTSVFDIASINVNEDALGAATISEGSGTKKILLENVGAKYAALDEGSESFLTIVYRLKTATPGDYRFGLDINSTGDNNVSAAYYIAEGEQKGNQTRVPLVVNEPTLTLITVQEGVIEIGSNTSGTATEDYLFTYSKTNVGVQLVNEFTPDSTKVEYTYNGDATPVIKWYEADTTNPSAPVRTATVLASAPVQAGYYFIGISAPETPAYTAAEEKFALVHIVPLTVDVTIANKESEYKDELVELTYTTSVQPFEGDVFGIELSTEATNTSPVGDYSITGSTNETIGSYVFNFTPNATYTIKPAEVTITAGNQQAEYTGSDPIVDQDEYTVDGYKDELSTLDVIITKAPGVDVGSYDLTPSLSVTPDNYIFTFEKGIFSIVSQGKDTEYFEAFFAGKEVTYNGTIQDLLELLSAKDAWWDYSAENNSQKNANVGEATYTIGITITLTPEEAEKYTGGQTMLYFTKSGKINPAPITIVAEDKSSAYGEEPEGLTYLVTAGTNYNDELTVTLATESPIAANTNVGVYAINVSTNADTNYLITLTNGQYTVTKGQASATAGANNVYYNRDLDASATGNVNTIDLSSLVDIHYYSDSGCTEEVTPTNVGTYYVKAVIEETDNYFGATSVASFSILPVRLEGVNFTYNHGQATWTAVSNDTGKTSTETGVEAKALKEGTIITYYVYDGNALIATINSDNERIFNALASTTYKVVARASDTNYLDSESSTIRAYEVSFNEGEHIGNPTGIVSNMPDPQYIFSGESAIAPSVNPSVPSCTFTAWTLNEVEYDFSTPISGDITIVAKWDAITYTITLKYTPTSETEGVDLFKIEGLFLNSTVDYTSLNLNPTKESDDPGIYYTFANKWIDSNNVQYNAVNNVISDYTVAGDMTFVALYDTNYNSFTITYHFSNNESTEEYTQYGDTQSVQYGSEILYRDYTGSNVNWFKADYWYADAQRTSVVPTRMPNHDIDVYGTYKFDIGLGDVNADRSVTTDDITLYRQWIVGGYEMTIVEKGNEWSLVNSQDFDPTARYYLKRVADNNLDGSRDIRDVSITRMAIVSGYDWDISSGTSVSGQGIDRTVTVTSIDRLISALGQSGRARIYADLADTEAIISVVANVGDLYLDLNGHTLTVKSLALSTNGINATITVRNGTIVTTDGITIVAPNGNVIIEDVIGYINESQVNLQAADNSLHLAGTVKFYRTENEQNVPAPINVEEGTHVVIEENAVITIEKIVVTEEFVPNPEGEVTLDNNTDTPVIVDGNVKNYVITTLAELVEAASKTGEYVLGADIAYNGSLSVTKDISIDLNGYTIRSNNDVAIKVNNGATLTLSGDGYIIAQEACVMAFNGSHIVINGGTYTAIDNFIFGTNGSAGQGNNSITINAGTFNGGIQTAGYVACGIYVANNDTVVVNGGTFNITNGCGILSRSGNTTINNGVVINATGTATGKVGDSRVVVPAGQALVLDLKAGYPGGVPTINNNTSYEVYVIVDGTYTFAYDDASFHAARGVYDNVILTADLNDYLYVNKDMNIYLNGHTVDASQTSYCTIYVTDGAKVTINGDGLVKSREGCVLITKGSELVVNGGTYTALDNFVIGSNGSEGLGNNKITINGGVFNGQIISEGYVACGIYVANNDTVVVNGGTFNITNGCGILARSGNTTINEGAIFNVNGSGTGKVGDSRVVVPAGQALVLDLKANYPGGTPIINNNSSYNVYVVVDGSYTFANDDASFHAARGVYDNVILTADLDDYLYVNKDMNIYLNGHTVDVSNSGNVAIYVVEGAKLTINGDGLIKSREGCVMAFDGSEFIINGGTYTALDNFVFGTNGTAGRGENKITINGGTFNGQIFSEGYVACGIYVANSDTVVVNGGTFNITNGCGILSRSGNTTINNGVVINATGTATGKVGDSRVVVPAGQALVLDLQANYPGGTPTLTNDSGYSVYTIEA